MAPKAIERLARAIGYPDKVADESPMATLRVDGVEVSAAVTGDRIVLSHRLTDEAEKLPTLAGYAAGRMLREEAVLTYGDGAAFLWQDAPSSAGEQTLLRLFESFMDSCDWWRARVDGPRVEERAEFPEMMIRP